MSEPELITLEAFKKFSEKCKNTFQEVPIINGGEGQYIIIHFNKNILSKQLVLNLLGYGTTGATFDSSVYRNTLVGFVNNRGMISIEKAWIISDGLTLGILLNKTIQSLWVSFSIQDSDGIEYKTIDSIDLTESYTIPSAGIEYIETIGSGDTPLISFSLLNKNGETEEYSANKEFDSIQSAGEAARLTNPIPIEFVDAEIEGQTICGGDQEPIKIPHSSYIAGAGIKISDRIISTDFPLATKTQAGIVQPGTGIEINGDGVISTTAYGAADHETLGLIKVGGADSDSKLYVKLDEDDFAYVKDPNSHRFSEMPDPAKFKTQDIIEYIGNSTSDYTTGYFYQCWPKIEVKIPHDQIKPINDTIDTGYLFAQYFSDKCWTGGNEYYFGQQINIKDLNGVDLVHNSGDNFWSFGSEGDRIYKMPFDDLKKIGMQFTGSIDDLLSTVVLITIPEDNFIWVQKNVQPAAFLDSEGIDFMSNGDVDALVQGEVTKITIDFNASSKGEYVDPTYTTSYDSADLEVYPEFLNYSSTGGVNIEKTGNYSYTLDIQSSGTITFTTVIGESITKTINIVKQ